MVERMRFVEERDKRRRILVGAIVSKVQKKRGLATSGRAVDEGARGRGELAFRNLRASLHLTGRTERPNPKLLSRGETKVH